MFRIFGLDPRKSPPSRENFRRQIHPEDRDWVRQKFEQCLRERVDRVEEYRVLLADGTVRHIASSGHPVVDENGELIEFVGTAVDVTERKRAQEERERLRQLEADLAHMNRVSMMGELAASLAHEITQPIASARNNARAALNFLDQRPPDIGEVREAIDCVVGDSDRAGDIVDRIREHIKKAPPRKERFDLNAAINEVIALARSAITENCVSVQTGLADGLFPVQGDCVQVQQVVLNLVLNAVEAMGSVEAGARGLSISTEQTKTSGVLVAVRDSGPGIDPEHLERVFEAFYTTKSSGTGMGLSICRSIIDAHGGRLWAEANEPVDRLPQRPLLARCHALPDAHGLPAVHRDRSHGVGALPYRQKAGASERAARECPGPGFGHHHETARQDTRGSLPDRGRRRARPAALPRRMGGGAPDRRLSARRTRHARPAPRSREALRALARSRDAGYRLRPDGDGPKAGAGAGVGVLRHWQIIGGQRAS